MAAASKKLIEVYVDLLNLLECPVCLKYASSNEGPIKLCTEGHFICGVCAPVVNSCPICRGQHTNVRPRILEQIIETLVYPCCKVGCGTMLSIKDIHPHELQCVIQEDKDIKYDKNMVQSQNILKHIEEHYSSFYLKPGDDINELGLCMHCLYVGLTDKEDELPLRNPFDSNQGTNDNQPKTEEPGNTNAVRNNVQQQSENIEGASCSTISDIWTKEIGIQCNLNSIMPGSGPTQTLSSSEAF
ncbi:E3 ubiquitin-protein ligase sina isoform X2 [Halyomorpha halys]|nr:E3 ubiquitin-protein ligase sina-like isoform X2 [Halyomorpha halys]XP_014282858.1 E3 ubiquitin-protein ligase sina-like isoform X2 [Halyomorpha halys]XP_014282865.1 E3 ubiquitin-protein ligase sina-like isoform X2 [Halyomorpha halys]